MTRGREPAQHTPWRPKLRPFVASLLRRYLLLYPGALPLTGRNQLSQQRVFSRNFAKCCKTILLASSEHAPSSQYMEYREQYFPPRGQWDMDSVDTQAAAHRLNGSPIHTIRHTRLERSGSARTHVLTASKSNSDNQIAKVMHSSGDALAEPPSNLQGATNESSRWHVKLDIKPDQTSQKLSFKRPLPRNESPPTPEMQIAGEITDLMQFQQSPRCELKRTRSKAE